MAGLTKSAILTIGALVGAAALGAFAYHVWQAAVPAPIAATTKPAPATRTSSTRAGAAARGQAKQAAQTEPHARHSVLPSFDVVRVEPSGDTVVAGRAAPNAELALLDKGKVIAKTKADANGQFTFIPPPLPAGSHLLALGEKTGDGEAISAQTVTVAVPKAKGEVLAALTEPGQPTRLLSAPAPAPSAGTAPKTAGAVTVAIRTVEMEQRGGFFATGSATPGAEVRLYLNDSALGDLRARPDGSWSLHITKGMQPGSYIVRADQIDAASGRVVARAQVPFDYKAAQMAETGTDHAARNGASEKGALAAAISTVTVVHGDSLWRISRKVLGHGIRYTEIYAANAWQIRNPALIYPGQVFVTPQTKVN